MSDRKRLLKILNAAARPKRKLGRIVCYDAQWAGLPRITIYDRPRRRKVGRRQLTTVAARRRLCAAQLELAL